MDLAAQCLDADLPSVACRMVVEVEKQRGWKMVVCWDSRRGNRTVEENMLLLALKRNGNG